MKFGIILSKKPAPSTFKENANHFFLKDDTVIISFDMQHLKKVVCDRDNLIELLECGVNEVILNANKSLGQDGLGLFDC